MRSPSTCPAEYDGLVKYVQVNGRTKIALRNVISEYIPNPTFNKVVAAGAPGAGVPDQESLVEALDRNGRLRLISSSKNEPRALASPPQATSSPRRLSSTPKTGSC